MIVKKVDFCKETEEIENFEQIKADITCFFQSGRSVMIADIGCPNTVISEEDTDNFLEHLNQFQQENLQYKEVDRKFKFGPSGPYDCNRKMTFPIQNIWVEVSIVQAKIPMLLGNNILKPLGAKIQLFPSGNGIMKLQDTVLKMTETSGGHYTINVSDLGKFDGPKEDQMFCTKTEQKSQKYALN